MLSVRGSYKENKFLKSISRHSFKLPADYKFNRDEIHKR